MAEVDDGIKVINTLSELIYPQLHHENKQPEQLEVANSVTEAEIAENLVDEDDDHDNDSYIDSTGGNHDEEPDFSDPIDIVTEHDDDQYHEAPEENEIPDETDDLETEFIQHETEPLLQDIANQMMHLIEESTATEQEVIATTTVHDQAESEGHANDAVTQANKIVQTEAAETEQATELIDVRAPETSEASETENLDGSLMHENKNEDLLELTTAVDEAVSTPTDKPAETESSSTTQSDGAQEMSETKIEDIPSTSASLAEPTAVTEVIMDATTEAIEELTSRTTVMEPNAEVSSTIANFIHDRHDEVTTVAALSSEVTTKDTRRKVAPFAFEAFPHPLFLFAEKIHRADLDNLAVSLGLPCHSDSQCQLADANTFCSEQRTCECESARSSVISSECSATNTGCADGTFQVIFLYFLQLFI